MWRATLFLLMLALCAPASAQSLIAAYTARIAPHDTVNSNGVPLTTAAAIIRQDRANFHRFRIRDAEDESDPYFADANNRAALEALIARGTVSAGALAGLRGGQAMVRVEIWTGSTGDFVRVRVF